MCLVLRKEYGEMESEMVKMKSKDNNKKVKFVCTGNLWDEERKLDSMINVNY